MRWSMVGQVSFYTKLKKWRHRGKLLPTDKKIVAEENWLHWLKTARAKGFVAKNLKERKEQAYLVQGHDILKNRIVAAGINDGG